MYVNSLLKEKLRCVYKIFIKIVLTPYFALKNKRINSLAQINEKLNNITDNPEISYLNYFNDQLVELKRNQTLTNSMLLKIEEILKCKRLISTTSIDLIYDKQFLEVESLFTIYNLLPNLKFLPATRGWAGSPDFLAKIIETILKIKPRLVVEAGSGVSTVVISLALKLNGFGRLISLDHDKAFTDITRDNILINDAVSFSEVILSPLIEYNNVDYKWIWYDIGNLDCTEKIDILIIDGPPGSTAFLARYPGVPLLISNFADRVLILLDDANRKDETLIIEKWITFLELRNYNVKIIRFNNFEKGLVILDVRRID